MLIEMKNGRLSQQQPLPKAMISWLFENNNGNSDSTGPFIAFVRVFPFEESAGQSDDKGDEKCGKDNMVLKVFL